ncbi:MAG: 4Fe-4S dicluster-binding protein [archaeon]
MAAKKSWKEIPVGGMITEAGSSASFKTGDWKSLTPVWNNQKCIHCMICPVYCPEDCIPRIDGKRLETDFSMCKGCGICADVCPVKCIEMKEEGQ